MKNRGFTLIELLVVIAIIGLLSAIATVSLQSAGRNSRNAKRKADLVQLSKALDLYYSNNDAYPSTGGLVYGACNAGGNFLALPDADPADYPTHTSWIPGLTAGGYMARLPRDPNTGKGNPSSSGNSCNVANWNCYAYYSDGVDYKLRAFCTPEGTMLASDQFYDSTNPVRAWAIYTPGAVTKGW